MQATLKQVREALDAGYTAVPLLRELPADTLTPVAAFLRLRGRDRAAESGPAGGAFLFESAEGGESVGRYSFLGRAPFETVAVRSDEAEVERQDGSKAALAGPALHAVEERLARYRAPSDSWLARAGFGPDAPRFRGGAVGFVAYEAASLIEPTVRLPESESGLARLMVFADVAAFDHLRRTLCLSANVIAEPGVTAGAAYRRAERALAELGELLGRPAAEEGRAGRSRAPSRERARRAGPGAQGPPDSPGWAMGHEAFMAGVRAIKRRVAAGDIFQAVLSDRLELPLAADPFEVYRALRRINPSPYLFYMELGGELALGASPEMLVRVEDGVVEMRPIAGTRPRGRDEEEDRRLEASLSASVKEKAEHLMLVDLGRNDVGRVARPGSVGVDSFMKVERFSHVMHLVSRVRGRLAAGRTPWDAFRACFPAGTVTGAPKIRAMQILSGLEPVPRGLYAGAVLHAGFQGGLDSAIAIRSLQVSSRNGRRVARVQAGAGIVADSAPARELAEVRAKAGAMLAAIAEAEKARAAAGLPVAGVRDRP